MFKKPRLSDSEPELIPESWREWIPKDDLVWTLKALIREFDLSGLANLYADCGGVAYDPAMLLALVLYGALDGVHTTRDLEKHCQTDVRYRYLMDGLVPDHCSVSRFRKRAGDALADLLAQTADYLGLAGRCSKKKGALDGTRIPGNVNQWKRLVKNAEERETSSDPGARKLRRTRGDFINGYNLQVAVDGESGAVLGCAATAESNDGMALNQILEACDEQGGLPEKLALDAGYSSSACAESIADYGVEGYAAPQQKEDGLFWKEGEDGRLACPAGHELRHRCRYPSDYGTVRVRYWVKECPGCPLKATCCQSKNKTLTVPEGVNPVHWVRNAHRARSPEGEEMFRLRRQTVERFFAQTFWNQRFRRLLMRGLSGARIHLLILCLAHNFRLLGSAFLDVLREVVEGFRRILDRSCDQMGARYRLPC